MLIQQTALDVAGCSKLSKRFTSPYLILKALDRDRYVVSDIPGNPRKQRVYESIISLERLKPYSLFEETDSEESGEELDFDDDCDNGDLQDQVERSEKPKNESFLCQERPSCERINEDRAYTVAEPQDAILSSLELPNPKLGNRKTKRYWLRSSVRKE